jgi:hypothetical protein
MVGGHSIGHMVPAIAGVARERPARERPIGVHADRGCALAPPCLTCPFSVCFYEYAAAQRRAGVDGSGKRLRRAFLVHEAAVAVTTEPPAAEPETSPAAVPIAQPKPLQPAVSPLQVAVAAIEALFPSPPPVRLVDRLSDLAVWGVDIQGLARWRPRRRRRRTVRGVSIARWAAYGSCVRCDER